MNYANAPHLVSRTVTVVAVLLIACLSGFAQKREYIQANAMGTSTQLGRLVGFELMITEYSTEQDRQILIEAFQAKGSEGLTHALEKMKSKGRLSMPGTLGFDVNFIRSIDMPDGSRKIRFVTDRPITFGEAWTDSRSKDYALSMGEIIISPDKKKSSGTVFPASTFTINKQNELEIETFQNPWKLVDVRGPE